MAQGFTYQDAMHMSPADYRRFAAIAHAWQVPPERRARDRMATIEDIDAL